MSPVNSEIASRLHLGISAVNNIFPGFEAGDFAVLHGSASNLLLFDLCIRCQLPPSRGGLSSPAVFIDGGNIFNPYLVAESARRYGLNPRMVLQRIYVSRAFTAYQLSSLILERLEEAIEKFEARFVAVSEISSLFLDRDVPRTEAEDLFVKVCRRLQKIAAEGKAIIAASHTGHKTSRRTAFLESVLYGKASIILGLKRSRGILKLMLERHPRIEPFTLELRGNEARLTDFMEVKTGGEDSSIL